MCTLIYFYRPSSGCLDRARGSLCLRLIHKRRVKTITTGYMLYPEEWDAACRRLVYPSTETERSRYLLQIEAKMEEDLLLFKKIVGNLQEQGSYSVEDVAKAYSYRKETSSLAVYGRKQEMQLIRLGQNRTARAYRSSVISVIAFNKGKDIALKQINPCLIKEYERSLKERGKSLNTISFYMRNLRAIYNKSVADKVIPLNKENPFAGVYTGVDKTKKRALSLDEVGQLRKLNIPLLLRDKVECLTRAKRLFFFCFYARGMSFIDMAYLRKDNIKNGVISYYRKKTGQLIELKITPVIKELINSFSQETKYSKYVFPIITNEKENIRLQYENGLRLQNRRLKELGKLAGLNNPISTHVARHSWATIAKYERLPLSVISEGLGHSNEKTTYIYLASFERSRLDEANDLIGDAIERVAGNDKCLFG